MANLLRQRALAKLFGSGLSGAATASAVGWLADQARDALRKEPQRLDLSTLRPGETYLVTTRPALSRAEAKLDRRVAELAKRTARDEAPSRSARRAARRLDRAPRRLDRATPGSPAAAERSAEVDRRQGQLTRRTTPSAAQRRRAVRLAEARLALEAERQRVLGRASKSVRPPRTRRFT